MDIRKGNSEINKKLDFMSMVSQLNTAIPAIVDEFDATTQRVSATPAIKYRWMNEKGEVQYINYPKITNIPLAIQRGNGVLITYPIKKGEVCTLIFSQRSIDNFLIEGNIQKPLEGDNPQTTIIRCMDMTDAMCFPGVVTNKEFISNYSTSAVEIRNTEGNTKVSLSSDTLTLIQSSASFKMSEGNIEMSATKITINGTPVLINGKDWDTHAHSAVMTGPSNTGGVV